MIDVDLQDMIYLLIDVIYDMKKAGLVDYEEDY